jgi:hypothetical protein
MFGEMIGVETGAIVGLGDFEAVLVIVREGAGVAIKMIKDTEFHFFNACADLLTPRVLRLRLQLFLSLRQGSQPQRVQSNEALGVAMVVGDVAFLEGDEFPVIKRIGR